MRSELLQHMCAAHETPSYYSCIQCDSTFGERSALLKHVVEMHERCRNHVCCFGSCSRSFTRWHQLKRHALKMHNIVFVSDDEE